jgi:hypothetical protein
MGHLITCEQDNTIPTNYTLTTHGFRKSHQKSTRGGGHKAPGCIFIINHKQENEQDGVMQKIHSC